MHPDDLERLVDRALKQLPGPRAPRTLLPRVIAAIETGQVEKSSSRPWLSWPMAWKIASLAALVVLGVGLSTLWPSLQSAVQPKIAPALTALTAAVEDVTASVSVVATLVRAFWQVIVQPLLGYVLVLVLMMCAACAVFGAALGRVVLRGVPQT
jgi:uncharacterized membrane protein YfcA